MRRTADRLGAPLRNELGERLGTCEKSGYRHARTTTGEFPCHRWVPTGSLRALLLRRYDTVKGRVR